MLLPYRPDNRVLKALILSAFTSPRAMRFFAFGVAAAGVLSLVAIGMLVPLLAGLLAYCLVDMFARRIAGNGPRPRRFAMLYAVLLFVVALLAVFTGIGLGLHLMLHDGSGLHELLERMGDIVASARGWLPASLASLLPQTDALFASVGAFLKQHAAEVGTMSLDAIKEFGYALIGMLLGTMVAISAAHAKQRLGPVSRALVEQVSALRHVFWQVASAQVKISLLNTTLTSLYLLVALPAAGVHLPFTKTMIAFTFVVGMIPVVGNLISNTAITVMSLGHSVGVAAASLMFLIGVHKLEYFLNARIVGGHINARAWEILITMVVFERIFGIRGIVLAPIFYAWLKSEWHRWDQQPGRVRVEAGTAVELESTTEPG